jgi:RNA polymerase sigma-70 factor (ECF subfamily)
MKVLAEEDQFKDITDETILAREEERLINEAINKLPPQMQLVFKLGKQEGLSRKRIAEQLVISPNTVRNHMLGAVKAIRSHLDDAALTAFYLFWFFNNKL